MQKIILLWLAILPLLACAQAGKGHLPFYNITQFGFLQGEKQHTYSIQTINGIGWRKYNAGIGISLDNYGYQSLPVFADLRYSLLKKNKTALQVYGDAGLNVPLRSNELPAKLPNGQPWNKLHVSFYGEAGLSYSVAIQRKLLLVAGLGFNYKTFKYTETDYTGDITMPEQQYDYTYHYSKYVVRMGFGF